MTGEQIAGLVRTLVAGLGGIAIGKGWVDAELVAAVAGAAGVIAAAVWSFVAKKQIKTPSL